MSDSIAAVRGLSTTSRQFRRGLVDLSARVQIDPDWLASVMSLESGFNPAAVNPSGGATGLIQFMPATARRLGTTTTALKTMSAVEQLPWVEGYYRPFAGRIRSLEDMYMANFLPSFIGRSSDTVIASDPDAIYVQNMGFDPQKKGYITVGDVSSAIRSAYASARGQRLSVDDGPDDGSGSSGAGTIFLSILAGIGVGFAVKLAKERTRGRPTNHRHPKRR